MNCVILIPMLVYYAGVLFYYVIVMFFLIKYVNIHLFYNCKMLSLVINALKILKLCGLASMLGMCYYFVSSISFGVD